MSGTCSRELYEEEKKREGRGFGIFKAVVYGAPIWLSFWLFVGYLIMRGCEK